MKEARILLIEDDNNTRALLREQLLAENCIIDEASDGESGLELALKGDYDLLILDINLPRKDGLAVCRSVRHHNQFLPILMLSARRDEIDRVLGLEMGADDYLTKPFSIRELEARIRAILRRVGMQKQRQQSQPSEIPVSIFGDLEVDLVKRQVKRAGTPIHLSNMEFELLAFLSQNPGRPFSREEIMELVWGYTAAEYALNVSTHINRIRKKLEQDLNNPRYIKTKRGFGYAFADIDEL